MSDDLTAAGLSRRDFLRSTALAAGFAVTGVGFPLAQLLAHADKTGKDLREATRTTTICPYCAVGCGFVVHSAHGEVINIEGDSDHPINEGSSCAKGAALLQLAQNPRRLTKVRYRAPYSADWRDMSLTAAIALIAERIKATRDATFEVDDPHGRRVNRTRAIASLGSAALDNEECWLYQKFQRSLGLVYIEHQARN